MYLYFYTLLHAIDRHRQVKFSTKICVKIIYLILLPYLTTQTSVYNDLRMRKSLCVCCRYLVCIISHKIHQSRVLSWYYVCVWIGLWKLPNKVWMIQKNTFSYTNDDVSQFKKYWEKIVVLGVIVLNLTTCLRWYTYLLAFYFTSLWIHWQ